nr:heavy metal-associated isoprenylated plant protein 32-like [Coffea arabica]
MALHADAACVLKVNLHCEGCKMKTMEILGSIVGVYSVAIDGEEGLAKIYGEVDPNMLLRAIGTSGRHAELVRMDIKHPQINEDASCRRRHGYNYDALLENNPCGGGYGHGYGRSLPDHTSCYGHEQYYPNSYSHTAGGGALPQPRHVPSYPRRGYDPYDDERINCCSIM